jgi:hypothetical protein
MIMQFGFRGALQPGRVCPRLRALQGVRAGRRDGFGVAAPFDLGGLRSISLSGRRALRNPHRRPPRTTNGAQPQPFRNSLIRDRDVGTSHRPPALYRASKACEP